MGTRLRQSKSEVVVSDGNRSNFSDIDNYNSSYVMQFAERVNSDKYIDEDKNEKSSNTSKRKYNCKFCDFTANNAKQVLLHRRDVHDEDVCVYECDSCDYVTEYSSNFKKHCVNKHSKSRSNPPLGNNFTLTTRSASPERLYKCKYCEFTDVDVNVVKEHQLTHSSVFTCHVCLSNFDSHKQLKEHIAMHTGDEEYNDSRAKRLRLDTDDDDNRVCANVSEYQCPYCNFTCEATKIFRDHVVLHIGQKNFRCSFCNSLYKYRGDCAVHIKQKHNIHGRDASCYIEGFSVEDDISILAKNEFQKGAVSNLKSYGCGFCKYKSNYKADVRKHQVRMHSSSNRRVVKFSRPVELMSVPSVKSPSPETPSFHADSGTEQGNKKLSKLVCDICQSYTADSVAKLAAHQCAHSNIRPFKCSKCGVRANFRSNVSKHIRVKHQYEHVEILKIPDEEAARTIDDYMKNRNDVKNRAGFHTVNKSHEFTYHCSLCDFQTNYNAVMENHANKAHHITMSIKTEQSSSDERDKEDKEESGNTLMKRKSLRQQKGHKCPTCFQTFSLKFERDEHMNEAHYNQVDVKRKTTNTSCHAFSLAAKRKYNKLSMRADSAKAANFGTFKKLKCAHCFYRSNWKGDLFRHARKEHKVTLPTWKDIEILRDDEAQKTFTEYEATFGKVIRSRVFVQGVRFINYSWQDACKGIDAIISARANQSETKSLPMTPKVLAKEQRKVKSAIAARRRSTKALVSFPKAKHGDSVLVNRKEKRNSRATGEPVAPKPFECMFCGYRSNWKSDVLKHLRYSHGSQDRNDLRTLSYEEACATINQYEELRLYRVPICKRKQKIAEYDKRSTAVDKVNESQCELMQENEINDLITYELDEMSNDVSNEMKQESLNKFVSSDELINHEYIDENGLEKRGFSESYDNGLGTESSTYCDESLHSSHTDYNNHFFPDEECKADVLDVLKISAVENGETRCMNKNGSSWHPMSTPKLYRCSLCHTIKLSGDLLRSHVILHNLGGGYHCSMCDFASRKRAAVLLHVSCYHAGGAYVKAVLKHGFAELISFPLRARKHRRFRHPFLRERTRGTTYYCDLCEFSTAKIKTFFLHKSKHRQRRGAQHKCPSCGLTARSKLTLHKHRNNCHSKSTFGRNQTKLFRCLFCVSFESTNILQFCEHLLSKHNQTSLYSGEENEITLSDSADENLSHVSELDDLMARVLDQVEKTIDESCHVTSPISAPEQPTECEDVSFNVNTPFCKNSQDVSEDLISSLLETICDSLNYSESMQNYFSTSISETEINSALSDILNRLDETN